MKTLAKFLGWVASIGYFGCFMSIACFISGVFHWDSGLCIMGVGMFIGWAIWSAVWEWLAKKITPAAPAQ